MINYSCSKAEALCALYYRSKYQGISFLGASDKEFNVTDAEKLLESQTYFDYLYGKVMKVDLSKDGEFDPGGYDRDNGRGAAQAAISAATA